MKIWIDANKPAPHGYHWNKTAREAITTMQQADLAISRLWGRVYNGHPAPDSTEIEKHRVTEISMPQNFMESGDGRMFDIYLRELDRDNLRTEVH